MIPKNWDKIPLSNFIQYLEARKLEPKDEKDRFEILYKKASAILDISIDEARELKTKDQIALIKLMKQPFPHILPLRFKHKGIKYRPFIFANKLDGNKYSAIKTLQAKGNDSLHQVLFLVCEPVKFGFRKKFPFIGWKSYEFKPDEIGKRIEEFKDLPMEVANPISVFFLTLSKKLNVLLRDYSIQEMDNLNKMMKEFQASLGKDTDL